MIDNIKRLLSRWLGPTLPDTVEWNQYQSYFEHDYPTKTPIEEVRFIVLDTETTGLDDQQDEVLSLAAVAVQNSAIHVADRFEAIFRPDKAASSGKEGIIVHGILDKHTRNAGATEESLKAFLSYVKNSIIVGQHIRFDKNILNKTYQEKLGGQLLNRTIDTAQLAQRLRSDFDPNNHRMRAEFSLDELCKTYHITVQNRHTAAGDTMITAILFLKLLARLRKRGVITLKDLLQ
jgi:DNA polymerase-3 subunit epsilon